MKPYPKREEYAVPRNYERARADWLMSEVVPLLKEARYPPDDLKSWREWRDRIDTVLRELPESKP